MMRNRLQTGLTLLELLLVVFILSAVAFIALSEVSNDASQVRYEDTRNRLDLIRKSIIGDTGRTLNGQPEIRGFVADVGRVPGCLEALLIIDPDCDGNGTPDPGAPQPWSFEPALNIWAGWNGPYLTDVNGVFRDGWGNPDNGVLTHDPDYGWVVTPADTDVDPGAGTVTDGVADSILVLSLGEDGALDPHTYGGVYDADYLQDAAFLSATGVSPNEAINSNSFVMITNISGNGGITFDFSAQASCWLCSGGTGTPAATDRAGCNSNGGAWSPNATHLDSATCQGASVNGYAWQPTDQFCARLFRRVNGSFDVNADLVVNESDGVESSIMAVIWDGTRNQVLARFPNGTNGTYVPQGVGALMAYRYDSTASTCTTTKYPSFQEYSQLALLPDRPLLPVRWPVNE